MKNENDNKSQKEKIVSLSKYIEGLWKLGGIPVVLIGLGAANLFVPNFATYGPNEQLLLTSFMFVSGVLTWCVHVFLAYRRWKAELEIAGQRESQLIQSICKIVNNVESDAAADARIKTLTKAVTKLGIKAGISPFINRGKSYVEEERTESEL